MSSSSESASECPLSHHSFEQSHVVADNFKLTDHRNLKVNHLVNLKAMLAKDPAIKTLVTRYFVYQKLKDVDLRFFKPIIINNKILTSF